jgi:hypothetical protein
MGNTCPDVRALWESPHPAFTTLLSRYCIIRKFLTFLKTLENPGFGLLAFYF